MSCRNPRNRNHVFLMYSINSLELTYYKDPIGTQDEVRELFQFWHSCDTDRSESIDFVEYQDCMQKRLQMRFEKLWAEQEQDVYVYRMQLLPWVRLTRGQVPQASASVRFCACGHCAGPVHDRRFSLLSPRPQPNLCKDANNRIAYKCIHAVNIPKEALVGLLLPDHGTKDPWGVLT